MQVVLQGIFEPIHAQAKKAFVDPLRAINQGSIVGSDHLQALCDHPNVSQASSNEQTTETNGISQMAFVNVEASAFLVRKAGLNPKPALVIPASLIGAIPFSRG